MRLLVIEDEVRLADFLKKGLAEAGYVVDVAHDGIDGLHLAVEGTYDLVILDVMLPGKDGFEVLGTLRKVKRAQQQADEHSGHHAPAAAASASDDMTDGEVRKVDAEAGKITLKHGDIKSLDMPGMTMVFAVKDKAMLGGLKAGDKVKFKVISDSGKLTITELQAVR